MRAFLLLSLFLIGLAHAQGAYRWVDKDGKVHYGDRYPGSMAGEVQKRGLAAPPADKQVSYAQRQAMANFPVTLFVSKDCGDACKEGRDYLNKRAIPFSEKIVVSQEDIDALKELLGGGQAQVPVLKVGTRFTKGWLPEEWQRLLDAAGYPKAP
jgi:glutaredoxin